MDTHLYPLQKQLLEGGRSKEIRIDTEDNTSACAETSTRTSKVVSPAQQVRGSTDDVDV